MTYLIGKKSVVSVDGATLSIQAVQDHPSLGYACAYEWLIIDRNTNSITIDAYTISMIRKDSQKRVIDFVRNHLLSYDSITTGAVIKEMLKDYDNLISAVKAQFKKRKIDSYGNMHITDVFPVEIIIRNAVYFIA